MAEEAEDAEPIVHRDQQDPMANQRSVFVERAGGRASFIGAAVQPQHHRQRRPGRPDRRDDIQIEAVLLAGFGVVPVPVPTQQRLRAGSAKGLGVAGAAPRPGGQRRVPAQFADRRLCVGNAQELRAAARPGHPPQLPTCQLHGGRVLWHLSRAWAALQKQDRGKEKRGCGGCL